MRQKYGRHQKRAFLFSNQRDGLFIAKKGGEEDLTISHQRAQRDILVGGAFNLLLGWHLDCDGLGTLRRQKKRKIPD
jgi:hypothetical protein